MSQSTEQIEARLAAYIDGELDAAGRCEIEKHLASNPQYRQLIDDLIGQKQLIGSLPRESAPAEVVEVLQGQLERNALLNPVETDLVQSTMRINRWPQIRAIAAVLVVVSGLGAAVWFMLPSPSAVPGTLALREDAKTDHDRGDPAARHAAVDGSHVGELPGDSPLALSVPGRSPANGPDLPLPALPAIPSAPNESQRDPFAEFARQEDHDQRAARSLFLVVEADNPTEFREQVTNYFVGNRIAWRDVDEPMPQPLSFRQNQMALATRISQTAARLRSMAEQEQTGGEAVARKGEAQANQGEALAGDAPANDPAPEPTAGDQLVRHHARQQVANVADVAELNPQDKVIVAENLTTSQVEELHQLVRFNALNVATVPDPAAASDREGMNRHAPWVSPSLQGPQAPTDETRRQKGGIQPGENLTIHVPGLVAPGLHPENEVQVADDGTVRMPMLDPVEAAGLEPAELEAKISERYRELALLKEPQVRVRRSSTQPAVERALPLPSAPTTGPSEPVREAASAKTDVVIVLRGPTARTQPSANVPEAAAEAPDHPDQQAPEAAR